VKRLRTWISRASRSTSVRCSPNSSSGRSATDADDRQSTALRSSTSSVSIACSRRTRKQVRGGTLPSGRDPLASTSGSGWRRSRDPAVLLGLPWSSRERLLLPAARGPALPNQRSTASTWPARRAPGARSRETARREPLPRLWLEQGASGPPRREPCGWGREVRADQPDHVVSALPREATPGGSGLDGQRPCATPHQSFARNTAATAALLAQLAHERSARR
jgi:hypothetical protein